MALGPDNKFTLRTAQMTGAQARDADIDAGLRAYMLKVYNYMCVGIGVTGAVAFGASTSPAFMQAVYGTPLQWLVMLAPLGLVIFLSARLNHIKAATAQSLFWVFSALMGLSISYIFLAYTGQSVTRVFFITAGAFAGLSLFGYTTKRDLSAMGTFMAMGLIGLIIAMVVNIFLQSSAMEFVISVLGVLIFAGLTAWDTQKIKSMYSAADGHEIGEKKSVMGALTLYLDFLNMFLFLLRLFGNRN